jgi:hypothetical protein
MQFLLLKLPAGIDAADELGNYPKKTAQCINTGLDFMVRQDSNLARVNTVVD